MTREMTKKCLQALVRACYYGGTRWSRMGWVLRQQGLGHLAAAEFLAQAVEAKLIEYRASDWAYVTPFLVGIAANFDELAADVEAWQGDERKEATP